MERGPGGEATRGQHRAGPYWPGSVRGTLRFGGLFVAQRLGDRQAGGLARGDVGHQQRGEVAYTREDDDLRPGQREARTARIAKRRAREQVVREDRGGNHAGGDAEQGDEARLQRKAQRHLAAAVAHGPQHADLLPPLDDRAGGDYGDRGDADKQAEPHEALEQVADPLLNRQRVGDVAADRGRLHAVLRERRLDRLRVRLVVGTRLQPDRVQVERRLAQRLAVG